VRTCNQKEYLIYLKIDTVAGELKEFLTVKLSQKSNSTGLAVIL